MILPAFDDLRRLPVITFYEDAFHKATGVPSKLAPAGEPPQRLDLGPAENPICALLSGTPGGCAGCLESQKRLLRSVGKGQVAQQVSCFAGLTDAAAQVVIGGEHRAALLSGQFFRRQPTERDFKLVVQMLGANRCAEWEQTSRRAYFETRVVTAERFEAVLQLLGVFGQYLSELAMRQAIACAEYEPALVVNAKQFVQSHAEEPITLDRVVEHVHASRFYFCKLFKKVTGMALTEYVARVRVEKAKTMLSDQAALVYASSSALVAGADSSAETKRERAPKAEAKAAKKTHKKFTGAELYQMHCNRCHPERYPTEFTSAQWKTLLTHMRVRANLPASRGKEILKYMQEESGN